MESSKEVLGNIFRILKSKKEITVPLEEYATVHLFGFHGKLYARELMWLIFKLQDEYAVTFTEEDVTSGSCFTLQGLAKLIVAKKEEVLSEMAVGV